MERILIPFSGGSLVEFGLCIFSLTFRRVPHRSLYFVKRVFTKIIFSICTKIQRYPSKAQQMRRELMDALALIKENFARLIQTFTIARDV